MTAQVHSDECRGRIEQKMLEDTTREGAIRHEEPKGRKRARPDDEGGRLDVEVEGQQGLPFVPFDMVVPVRLGR